MAKKKSLSKISLTAVIVISILLIWFKIIMMDIPIINGYEYDKENNVIDENEENQIININFIDAPNSSKICKLKSMYNNNTKPMYFNEYQYFRQFEININELTYVALQFVSNKELLISYQSRNKCIVYIKEDGSFPFQSNAIQISKKYECKLFKYGEYKKDDFLTTTKQSKFAIIISDHDELHYHRYEFIQLMAYNVPLFFIIVENNKYLSISQNFDNSLCGHICVVDKKENLNKIDNCFQNIFLPNINKGIYKPSMYILKKFNQCSFVEKMFTLTLPLILNNISNELKHPFIPFYIFQIGFSKCGTRTLYYFFTANDIPSIHWKRSFESNIINHHLKNITLHEQMNRMHKMNKSVLTYLDKKYMFYSDYDSGFVAWYKILNKQYSNSKYILNIRNINHWLRSRYMHKSEDGTFSWIETEKTNKMRMYGINHNSLNQTIDIKIEYEILIKWEKTWYEYHCNLLQYFKSHNLLNNLLIFHIEYDSIDKLIKFFERFNLKLDKTLYIKFGNTKQRGNTDIATQKQLEKWDNRHSMFFKTNDNFTNEYQRIIHFCINNYHQK